MSGILRETIDLEAGAVLTEPAGGSLSVFGDVVGPASGVATIDVAAAATLFAAGVIGASVLTEFGGPNATLELDALYLPQIQPAIAGFAAGDAIDVVSGTFDSVSVSVGGGSATLTLLDEGAAAGTLSLAGGVPSGTALYAAPDAVDGTRLLSGAGMPPVTQAAPAGSGGGRFDWDGAASGQWADASAWRNGGGGSVSMAPGAGDSVSVAGPAESVLSLAGDGAAASLAVQGLVALAGDFAIGALTVGGSATDGLILTPGCALTATTLVLQAGALQVAGAGALLQASGMASLQSGLLAVADGGVFSAATLALAGGSVRLGAAGAIGVGETAGPAGTLAIGAAGLMEGQGTLRVPVLNDGTIQAMGGTLAIYGAVTGGGTAQIAGGATLYLPGGAQADQTIAVPEGNATLELWQTAASCAAVVTGFGVGDVVDIAGATLTQAAWSPQGGADGVLDLGAAGTIELSLGAGFEPDSVSFQLAPDGLGGTAVTMVPCFCEGTLLAGPHGPVAVEDVRVGDRLLTRTGAARRVRWIGRRRYGPATLARERQLRPVRVAAGTLGANLPARDLLLSPQHALGLDTPEGLRLVPAAALVDGERIRREPPGRTAAYVHIELDRHDLVLAEGAAAETFLPTGGERRELFQHTQGVAAPDGPACCPRLEDGAALEALRGRLGLSGATDPHPSSRGHLDALRVCSAGVSAEGWAAGPGPQPLRVLIMLDGAPAAEVLANRWRPDLDRAGIRGGSCGFAISLPWVTVRSLSGLRVSAR